jgi:hypothetical protein
MKYLNSIPRKPLPEGQVVIHNFPPIDPDDGVIDRVIGVGGFRIFQDDRDAKRDDGTDMWVVCNCGWAADRLPEHYCPPGREVS